VYSLPVVLVAAHVFANVVWIGAILSVAVVTARAPFVADLADLGSLARRIYWRLAVPGFLASLATGAARIALGPDLYAHLPWFHAKLGLAVIVIILHHIIGARARRVGRGNSDAGRGVGAMAGLMLVCVGGAVLLGVAKSLR
jgi:putative membrane protein